MSISNGHTTRGPAENQALQRGKWYQGPREPGSTWPSQLLQSVVVSARDHLLPEEEQLTRRRRLDQMLNHGPQSSISRVLKEDTTKKKKKTPQHRHESA